MRSGSDTSLDGLVPGWRFSAVEVSAGVYEVIGTDNFGRRISRRGTDYEDLLKSAAADARSMAGAGRAT